MKKQKPRRRLDEILLEQGLITETQIRDALARQKERGGRFGSQLLYQHLIDEESLIKALEIQFECPGVSLSGIESPPAVCEMIPRKIALTRKIIPFDFNIKKKILKIACEDPTDEELIEEIKFIARENKVKF